MGYHSALVLLTLAWAGVTVYGQLPCEMANSAGGFRQTGPDGGVFIDAYANQFADVSGCAQECCNRADNGPNGCRAAWFYKDHDASGQPRTVCQLWYCNPCTTIAYDPAYESQVSLVLDDRSITVAIPTGPQPGLPGQANVETTAEQGFPQDQGIPQDQGYPQDQGFPQVQGPPQDQGIYGGVPQGLSQQLPGMDPQTGYSTQGGIPSTLGADQTANLPQQGYDTQQQGVVDQTVELPQATDQQQGQWVYNPATGDYTFVNQPAPVDAQQPLVPGEGQTTIDGQPPLDPMGYPSFVDEGDRPESANDTLSIDPLWREMNDTDTSAENSTMETSTTATSDWWDWWPFGGDNSEDGETEEEQEKEEEEWEKEWEEEEEEEEKEWEEEVKQWDEGRSTTVYPFSSTTYRAGGDDREFGADENEEQWLQDIQGLQEEGALQDTNNQPPPIDGGNPIYPLDPFQESAEDDDDDWANRPGNPNTVGQTFDNDDVWADRADDDDDDWAIAAAKPNTVGQTFDNGDVWGERDNDPWAVNAPVIAVVACAAVVLVLLLLVLLGKRLAGKNDRAQYKPLRESFSGSSTYHEEI